MVSEQMKAVEMFLDCLTTLTNVTGVRCETALLLLLNGVRYRLDWEPGRGYIIVGIKAAVEHDLP